MVPVKMEIDVLVLGGGSAGLCSAMAAREAGASVILIYKAGGNSTAVAAGGYAVVLKDSVGDSVEQFIADAERSGAGLVEPDLLHRLAEGAIPAIERAAGWGVEFYRTEDGQYRRFRSGGHTFPRSLRCASGRGSDTYGVLYRRARACGITMLKDTLITELLRSGERVVGAAGMDEQGRPLVIAAKTVILATGGMAALYEHTTTTSGVTGEGYIMALESGCRLRDMEFIQFMPTTLAAPASLKGKLVNDTLRGEGAYLLNRSGERFMTRYAPDLMEVSARDVLSYAIATEVSAGRGSPAGGVYVDARHIPEKALLQSFGAVKALRAAGIDPSHSLIEVTPAAHFSCGGVAIDVNCRTGVPGLYAVGEVTGGIHGANRLGATALTENLVFGQIAGALAAEESKKISIAQTLDWPDAERCVQGAQADPDASAFLMAEEQEIRRILWTCGGILRNGEGLSSGLVRLGVMTAHVSELPTPCFSQQQKKRRLIQLVALAQLVLQSALRRTESRGCHTRTDFPNQDPSQSASYFLTYERAK